MRSDQTVDAYFKDLQGITERLAQLILQSLPISRLLFFFLDYHQNTKIYVLLAEHKEKSHCQSCGKDYEQRNEEQWRKGMHHQVRK